MAELELTRPQVSSRQQRRRNLRDRFTPYLYILPAFALVGLFEIWPIFFGFWMSLWRWGLQAERFVGLENYARMVEETLRFSERGPVIGEMGRSLLATLYYVIGTVPLTLVLAFFFAQLLMRPIAQRGLFRTIFFMPYVTSVVAAALVFGWIFNSQIGIANLLLEALGLPRQSWLLDPEPIGIKLLELFGLSWPGGWPIDLAGPSLALVCIILFSVWQSLGFSIVIFMAGLANIPQELYDAAKIDGASGWRLTRYVTLPLLSPTTFFLLIVSIIYAFQSFTPVYVLSGGGGYGNGAGGPLDTTLVITVYIVRNFYERASAVGYAAAVSFVLFAILLILTLIQFRILGRRVHYN
ncbi:MAG: sugar ABC transporter permease [Oscillochloris sp.]|nr:sugar ABC transporter permease [Oscillochloris sp.]